jgi:urease accessory protein UreF
MLRQVWPDRVLDWLADILCERHVQPALAVVLGVCSARQGIRTSLALAAFLQSYIANLVTAGVPLIPLGQTDGQLCHRRARGSGVGHKRASQESHDRRSWFRRVHGRSRLDGA